MENSISACLVVFNEASVIERCLKSLADVVDEIIVVHDGKCTDRTLEIAKKYKAKVFVKKYGGSCEKHRIFSFEQASSEWILMIDADEYLSKGLHNNIKKLVKNKKTDAYCFRWPIFDGKKYIPGTYSRKTKTVLVRKSKMYYIAITHEYLATYGKMVTRRDLLLDHKPKYNSFTFSILFKKLFKWGNLEASQILGIESAEMFNIIDKDCNDHYMYYQKFKKHPVIMTIKLMVYDFYNTFIKEKVFLSSIANWKIFIIKEINYAYLGYRIFYLKLKHGKYS